MRDTATLPNTESPTAEAKRSKSRKQMVFWWRGAGGQTGEAKQTESNKRRPDATFWRKIGMRDLCSFFFPLIFPSFLFFVLTRAQRWEKKQTKSERGKRIMSLRQESSKYLIFNYSLANGHTRIYILHLLLLPLTLAALFVSLGRAGTGGRGDNRLRGGAARTASHREARHPRVI